MRILIGCFCMLQSLVFAQAEGVGIRYLNQGDTLVLKKRAIDKGAWSLVLKTSADSNQYPFGMKTTFVLEGDTFYDFHQVNHPGNEKLKDFDLNPRDQLTIFLHLYDKRFTEIYLDSGLLKFEKLEANQSPLGSNYHEFFGDFWSSEKPIHFSVNHKRGSQISLLIGVTEDISISNLPISLELTGSEISEPQFGSFSVRVQGDIMEFTPKIVRLNIPGISELPSGVYQLTFSNSVRKIGTNGVSFLSLETHD